MLVKMNHTIAQQILDEMTSLYANAASHLEVCNLYKEHRATIHMYTAPDDESIDEELFDMGVAQELHRINTKLHYENIARFESLLPPNRAADIVETSNTTNEETTMSNATAVTTMNNISTASTSFDIESMSITELAELQLKIAQRMSQLLAAPSVEVVEVEPMKAPEVAAPTKETKPKASRVKKAKAAETAAEPTPKAEPVAAKATTKTQDLGAMSYKELQKFISEKTKACAGAKAQAQKVAREYGAKSWSTTGRKGYEEIYNLIK